MLRQLGESYCNRMIQISTLKDIEVLLRGFAMLVDSDQYSPSMVKFLNRFSQKCQSNSPEDNDYLKGLFRSFLEATSELPKRIFINTNNRFNIALYEAVFTATCKPAHDQQRCVMNAISSEQVEALRADQTFNAASQKATTQRENVQARLTAATGIISGG